METREDRRSALDDFAASVKQEVAVQPMSAAMSMTDQVHGAQAVAVKRDDSEVLHKLKVLAAAAGENWYYRFPVKNKAKGTTDWIEGPSIKLANDLSRMYGNCEVDCRAQDLGDHWLFHARFVDLESGYSLVRPFQQRKNASRMGGDEDRRLDIAFQIGASKAIRNVVVNALQTYADFAFEEAKNALVDKIGRNLVGWRTRVGERIAEKLDIRRVEAVMGRVHAEWLAPDIARIVATMKAVEDGMTSLDDAFPSLGADPNSPSSSTASLDTFAATGADRATPPSPATGKGTEGADVPSSTNTSADPIERLKRQLAEAKDEATVHQIWENLGLDKHFEKDDAGRRNAWALAEKRLKEVRK